MALLNTKNRLVIVKGASFALNLNTKGIDQMLTINLLTNPLFIIVYFSSAIPLAWIISRLIINIHDMKLQKRLKEITKKSQARIANDKKRHDAFMAEIDNKRASSHVL